MAVGDTYFESDGKSLQVDLLYTVGEGQVAVVDGWLGLAAADGDSGDMIALTVDKREYQFTIPGTLDVSKGETVYVEVADLTGHTPDSTAYSKTAGAGKEALFRATSDHYTDMDGARGVTGILLVP